MLAHAMPKPVMGAKSKYLFSIWGKISKPIPAITRQMIFTSLGLYFFARPTNANADKKVATLYHPFTRPVQPTASSYKDLLSKGDVCQTDFAILLDAFCQ